MCDVCLVVRYDPSIEGGGYQLWAHATRGVLGELGLRAVVVRGVRVVREKCRVIHLLGYGMPGAELYSLLTRRQVVWDPLAWFHTPKHRFAKDVVYRGLLVRVARRADLVIQHTRYFAEVLAGITGRNADVIVPCPLPFEAIPDPGAGREELRRKWGIPVDHVVAITVGWVNELKKPWEAVLAARKAGVDAHIIVTPAQPGEEYLRRLREAAGRETRLHVVVGVNRRGLAELYALSDVLVHASRYEGWGYVLVEAAWYGVPAAAYRVTAIPESAPWAELADPENGVESLADAIERALRRKHVPTQKWIRENYSVSAVARRLAPIYKVLFE